MQFIDPSAICDKQTTESIFCQLLQTTCSPLQRTVKKWFLEYHGETLHLDPLLFSDRTSKHIRILKTISKCNDTSTSPEIMALKACIDDYTKKATSTFNAITTKLNKNLNQNQASQCPPWFSQPLTEPNQTHEHDGRTWHWCDKCTASRGSHWSAPIPPPPSVIPTPLKAKGNATIATSISTNMKRSRHPKSLTLPSIHKLLLTSASQIFYRRTIHPLNPMRMKSWIGGNSPRDLGKTG
jgi:hypothetical protein